MAESSLRNTLIEELRRVPFCYRLAKTVWRRLRDGWMELLRACSPRMSYVGMPKGTFSLLEQVRSGKVEGAVFFERQDVPDFGPDSLVERAGLNQGGFQPWPVFRAYMENARLIGPNLLVVDKQKRACSEAMFGAQFSRYDKSYNCFNIRRPRRLEGNYTSLPGRLDAGYWHFLLDTLPRLHCLSDFPADTKILIRPNPPVWQRELFGLLGVSGRLVEADFHCAEIERYYFSSFTSMTGACNPFAVQFLREKLLPAVIGEQLPFNESRHPNNKSQITNNGARLYLKRGAQWSRGITNEDEVCEFFESRGWRVVSPENLSVREQMGLFRTAKAICSVHGSALTNLLWVNPGTRVLELVADNFILGSFEWLARCVDAEHKFLLLPGDHRLSLTVDMVRLRASVDGMSE